MSITIDINVCRVCCKPGAASSILKYAKKFQYCTSLQVFENDGLPSKICDKCVVRLKISYEFKSKSEHSDKQLRIFINDVNDQFHQAVSDENVGLEDEEEQILAEAGYELADVPPPEEPDTKLIVEQQQEEEKFRVAPVIHKTHRVPVLVKPEQEIIEIIDVVDDFDIHQKIQQHEDEALNESELTDENQEGQVIYINLNDQEADYQDQPEGELEQSHEEYMEVSENDHEEEEKQEKTESGNDDEEIYHIIEDQTAIKREKSAFKKEEFKCVQCNKDFSTRTNLYRHIHTHDGSKPYQCKLCGNGFTQNGSLKQHMLIHTGVRPYACTICDRGFTQSKSLQFHMRRHTGEKPFPCTQCGLTFRQKDGLKRHILVKHSETEAKCHPCEFCKKTFNSKYSLTMHQKRHELIGSSSDNGCGEHRCVICDHRFPTKEMLTSHSKLHSGMFDLIC